MGPLKGSTPRGQRSKKPFENSSVTSRQTKRPATVMPWRAELSRLRPPPQIPGLKDDGDEAEQKRRRADYAQDQPNDAEAERGHGESVALLAGGLPVVARSRGHLGL
jgi:hypothetical protein